MNDQALAPIKIGRIHYVNALPFYHGFPAKEGEWTFQDGYPAQLSLLMRKEALDLAPISSIEYARHPGAYFLLPDFSISSRHSSGSVLLLSKEKIERLDGEKIVASKESLSSRALLQILLAKKFNFQNEFVLGSGRPHEMLTHGKACLVIGDEALSFQSEEFVYKYDLSEWWYEWTGKPFCFSLWAIRRKFSDENHESTARFFDTLKQNTEKNLSDLRVMIREALGLEQLHENFARMYSYFSHLDYAFGPEEQDGLLHFFSLAQETGLVPSVPPLEFFEPLVSFS